MMNDSEGSMVNVLTELGIDVRSSTGPEIAALCPFHEDSRPSFSMNARSGLWMCHGCGARGAIGQLVEALTGVTVTTPVEMVREARYKATRGFHRAVSAPEPPPPVPESPERIQARFEAFGSPPGWALTERLIAEVTAWRYHLRWDRGWVIPIWSSDAPRQLWGWQFKRLKTVLNHPPGVRKSLTLFGLAEARGSPAAVVVESPLDVVRLASVSIPAIATYGAYVSNHQVELIIDHFERLVLALDDDEAGQAQTERLYKPLARQMPVRRVTFNGAKDPGDLEDDECLSLFDDVLREAKAFSSGGQGTDARQRRLPLGARHGAR